VGSLQTAVPLNTAFCHHTNKNYAKTKEGEGKWLQASFYFEDFVFLEIIQDSTQISIVRIPILPATALVEIYLVHVYD